MRFSRPDEHDALLKEHGPTVWRLVVRLIGNDGEDAADCFQQAFVELASRQRRNADVRQAAALLKRIAAARAVDIVRRRMRERRREAIDELGEIASARSLEPDVRLEAHEFLRALREALAELPETQSTAFALTQVDGVTHEDAASVMGVKLNHLGVLLHRARTALRARLKAYRPTKGAMP